MPGNLFTSIDGTDIVVYVSEADFPLLTPQITHTGASLSPLSGVEQDFTDPVTYTVTAGDSSTQIYTITAYPVESDLSPLTALLTAEIGANHSSPVYARDESEYTPLTWADYESALQFALSVESFVFPTVSLVADVITGLQDAIDGLVFVVQADLDLTILDANSRQQVDYNVSSWTSFIAARDAALALPETSSIEILLKQSALEDAINLLRKDVSITPLMSITPIIDASRVEVDETVTDPRLDVSAL